mgnify:CR=1 FL=1
MDDQIIEEISNHYRHLHRFPELSFHEHKTASYVADVLRNYGLDVVQLPSNAVLALFKGQKQGKTIGLRAELDALPIQELTGIDYASQNEGVMHACGHDLHMACALGTFKMLVSQAESVCGNVLFIFQHAEEKIPGGAKDVLESSFFQKNKPDVMLALHSFPDLKVGEFGVREGAYMASGDEIDILVHGPGGHAALPHKTVDTVLVASQIVVALQQVASRFIPSDIPSVLTFGNISANSVMNIIPKLVKLEGTFRIMVEEWRNKAIEQIKNIAVNLAKAAGATCEVVVRRGYPAISNHSTYTRKVRQALIETFGADSVKELPIRMTTDDFGYYAQAIPSVYFRLGVADALGQCAGLHTSEFLPQLSAIRYGVEALTEIINYILND